MGTSVFTMSAHPDPMRHVLLAAGCCSVVPNVLAQCGMTTTVQANISCTSPLTVSVFISGGTPPYTIVFKQNGITVQTAPSWPSTIWSPTAPDPGAGNASVTVTDSQGCQANGSTNYTPHFYLEPNLTTTSTCTTGTIVRWNGQYLSPGPYSTGCPATIYYALNNGQINNVFPNGWTQESPTTWRYDQPLPQGTNSMWVVTGGVERTCGFSKECYFPRQSLTAITDPGDCGTNFRLRAGLDGALPSGTLMNDALRVSGLLPLTEPYTALGYTYTGSASGTTITAAQLAVAGDNALVDWVIVEVRASIDPFQVLYSKAALLQRDGDVVDVDGSSYVNCPLAPGSYRVAIKHRNHLGVMTGTSQSLVLNPASTLIDFRSASTATYGSNAEVLKGSIYCLWAGDATGNGTLSYSGANNDRDPILIAVGSTTPNATVSNVYDRRDTNLDGMIKYTGTGNDRDIMLTNVGSTTPNNTRTQQLP